MLTLGFTCGLSDVVTLDTRFTLPDGTTPTIPIVSTYIFIPTGGTEGGVVFENSAGETCWWPWAYVGYNIIAARKILTSATVKGISRTTAATPLYWAGSYRA